MYDAITIDTNVIDQQNLNLEGGILKQLYQFRTKSTNFILSEVVVREVRRHLEERAKAAGTSLSSAVTKSREQALFDVDTIKRLEAILQEASSATDAAERRLQAFLENTGCETVPADSCDMTRLMSAYFRPTAPFEGSGKKKNEFPDAIALMTLEDWGKKNNKRILAISKDGGWISFANASQVIDVEPDLPAALQKLQEHAEKAEKFAVDLIKGAASGNNADLLQTLEGAMEKAIDSFIPYADASSYYGFDAEDVFIEFHDIEFPEIDDQGTPDLYVLQAGSDEIVIQVNVEVKSTAEADFHFHLYDSVDKDYVSIGGSHEKTKFEFSASMIISLSIDFNSDPPNYEVTEVEVTDVPPSVDFGNVNPDFSDYRD